MGADRSGCRRQGVCGDCGKLFLYVVNGSAAQIGNYYDNEGNNPANPACPRDVDIPSSLGGSTTIEIANSFNGGFRSKSLTSVVIPSTVTFIGANAFANNQLTSITIPSSVTNIELNAFGSNQISSLSITPSTTTIGAGAFADNKLTTVTLYQGVTYDEGTFQQNNITSVDIQNGVTTLPVYLFAHNRLTSVSLPSTLTDVGIRAFYDNKLTSLTLPNSVTTIGEGAFFVNNLASLTLSNSLTTIPASAFAGNFLNEVQVPASVTTIEPDAFSFQGSRLAAIMWTETLLGQNGDPQDNATFLAEVNKLWYAQLMTVNHTNPKGLVDEANAITTLDFNGDGINDSVSIGGQIIDPTPLTV